MGLYPLNTEVKLPIATEGGPGLTGLSWGIVSHYQVAPEAVSGSAVISAFNLGGSAISVPGSAISQPDVPRVLSVKGSAAGVSGSAVISGVDAGGNSITETVAMNGANTVSGTKAFKRVDGVMTPSGSGLTFNVGVTKKIGLPFSLSSSALQLTALFDGSVDAGTLSTDGTTLALNTYEPAGTPDGTKLLDWFGLVR